MKRLTCFILMLLFTFSSINVFAEKIEARVSITGYGDYLADGKDYPASGCGDYEIGYCAVHYENDSPVIGYGTVVYIDHNSASPYGDPISTPIDELTAFQVQDYGDLNWNHSDYYWVDVYCGRYTDYSWASGDQDLKDWINFNIGTATRDIYFYR